MSARQSEQGFALLLVFAMASILAISLFYALPRVAFESERDREQLLIDRGEQYTRAIQLFVRKNKRFPAKLEDLENTNGIRFLRRRYVDPMTGKDEWRLIHAGPGGTLIDSLVEKKTDKKDAKVVDNFITELGPIGSAQPTEGNTNLALRRRPSDQTAAPGSANTSPIPPDPGSGAGPIPPSAQGNLNFPGQVTAGAIPPSPLPVPAGSVPVNGSAPAAAASGGGISVIPAFGGAISTPTTGAPPRPGQLPAAIAQQILNPTGVMPGGGVPSTGLTAGGAVSSPNAANLIQNLLTTPRPGGLAGVQGGQQAAGGQQIIGGGIAGVATTHKGVGVKLYHDQEEFPKWEFVYDLSKDPSMNPAANLPQAPAAPGTPIGGTAAQSATPAGAAPVLPVPGVPVGPAVPTPPQ